VPGKSADLLRNSSGDRDQPLGTAREPDACHRVSAGGSADQALGWRYGMACVAGEVENTGHGARRGEAAGYTRRRPTVDQPERAGHSGVGQRARLGWPDEHGFLARRTPEDCSSQPVCGGARKRFRPDSANPRRTRAAL